MTNEPLRYTMAEISEATKKETKWLSARRKQSGVAANRNGYTYEKVKRMLALRVGTRGKDPRKVDKLKLQLKTDGFL